MPNAKVKPTLVLADDHIGMLNKVVEILGEEVRILAKVQDGYSAVRAAQDFNPDLLVLDIAMPKLNGIEAARELRRRGLATKIIFLTVQEDLDYLKAAQEIGAGYVLKPRMSTDLIVAVREALMGRMFVSSTLTAVVPAKAE
jgi:DNA-binding NarL/FixJ family response regulator